MSSRPPPARAVPNLSGTVRGPRPLAVAIVAGAMVGIGLIFLIDALRARPANAPVFAMRPVEEDPAAAAATGIGGASNPLGDIHDEDQNAATASG